MHYDLIFYIQGNRLDMCCFVKMGNQKSGDKDSEGFLYKLVKDYYSHLLLKEWVRPIVVGSLPATQIYDRFTAYYTNL